MSGVSPGRPRALLELGLEFAEATVPVVLRMLAGASSLLPREQPLIRISGTTEVATNHDLEGVIWNTLTAYVHGFHKAHGSSPKAVKSLVGADTVGVSL
jgi:hypothetical protein